ncbi:MAG: type I methionyl aminopeptidase [Candidatus Magasanikbacteria bacterium]
MYKKTKEEVEEIVKGGKILGEILEQLSDMVEPGINAWEVDQKAEKLILDAGGKPAFKGYRGRKSDPPFPSTICASINMDLVHGIATKEKILKEGDIFSIDIGMEFSSEKVKGKSRNGRGYFTDTALTIPVGEIKEETRQLMSVTKKALEVGIDAVEIGGSIADIGKAIQAYVESVGNYGIVRDLVGHGVGHDVHEDPRVPNFYDPDVEKWKIEPGVVIAIEPMITLGGYQIKTADDGWSIFTVDNSLNAHYEHTICVTENGVVVATRRPSE